MAIHRYAGLIALGFLTIAGITGCLLCFEKPIDRWLNPQLFHPTGHGIVMPLAAVAAFEHDHPRVAATYFPTRPIPGRNIIVLVEARPGHPAPGYDQLFLDGGDGHVAGVRQDRAGWDRTHIVRGIYELHCWLLAGTIGRWIMGLCACIWLAGNLIGAYITLPFKGPYLRRWRKAWSFRPSPSLRQTLLDLHRVCGLWLLIPLSVLAFTSAAMSFYGEMLVPAVGLLSPPRPSPFDRPPASLPSARRVDFTTLLGRAEVIAAIDRPGWKASIIQQEPDRGLAGVRFTPSGYDEYRGLGPVTEWFDGSGRFIYADDPYRDSAGMAVERSLYPLHTGQMIGWPGIALDLVLGVVTAMLSLSGLYLWLKRRQVQRLARKRVRSRAAV